MLGIDTFLQEVSTAASSGGIHHGAVIGIDTFLQEVSKETLIPVQMLDNSNSIRDIRTQL